MLEYPGSFRKTKILFCLILLILLYLIVQNNWIQVERFEILVNLLDPNPSFDGLKIIHISDLHLTEKNPNVNALLKLIREQKPDVIMLTGDIIDSSADIERCGLIELCQGLTAIAQVYAVAGNHEVARGDLIKWEDILNKNGVVTLDNEYAVFEKQNQRFLVLGVKDGKRYISANFDGIEYFRDLPKILLIHRPELFNSIVSLNPLVFHPDLVLSGHAHGGQWRIPFIGGLFAPSQGFFPKYTGGYYRLNNSQMIVSRGLGKSSVPVRINNRPHLPVIIVR